jgi:hypothetical protein
MATTYYKRDGSGTTNWNSATSWSTVSATSATNTGTYPVAGDTALFTSGSIGGTVNVASACATLDMTGFADTLSGSTFSLTVSAGATIQGAFSGWTTGALVLTGGGVTLAATPTGSAFPILTLSTVGQTLTSGGFTWPGAMTIGTSSLTFTLVGTWQNSGFTTFLTMTLTGATYNFICAGGLAANGNITTTGINQLQITGGNLSGALGVAIGGTPLIGSVNLTTFVIVNTFNLIPGSTITGTGTLIVSSTNITITPNGVPIPNLTLYSGSSPTYTLAGTGNLLVTGTLEFNLNSPSVGWANTAFDIVCANLVINPCCVTGTTNMQFNRGRNITVTNSIAIGGAHLLSNPLYTLKVISNLASTGVNLNYTGALDNEFVFNTGFTDIKCDGSGIAAWVTDTAYTVGNCVAQGGLFYRCIVAHTSSTFATDLANGDWVQMVLQPLYSQYSSTPPTLLRTTGIVNVQANSFAGMFLS